MFQFQIYISILLGLLAEYAAVRSLQPGQKAELQPIRIGAKYVLQGALGSTIEVARNATAGVPPPSELSFIEAFLVAVLAEAPEIQAEPVGGTIPIMPIQIGANYTVQGANGAPLEVARVG